MTSIQRGRHLSERLNNVDREDEVTSAVPLSIWLEMPSGLLAVLAGREVMALKTSRPGNSLVGGSRET